MSRTAWALAPQGTPWGTSKLQARKQMSSSDDAIPLATSTGWHIAISRVSPERRRSLRKCASLGTWT